MYQTNKGTRQDAFWGKTETVMNKVEIFTAAEITPECRVEIRQVMEAHGHTDAVVGVRNAYIPKMDARAVEIAEVVVAVSGVSFADIAGQTRNQSAMFARMVFVYECRKRTNMSLNAIGRLVNRKHSSIIHILKQYQSDMSCTPDFRELAQDVATVLNARGPMKKIK